jgi:hypothetical protein
MQGLFSRHTGIPHDAFVTNQFPIKTLEMCFSNVDHNNKNEGGKK